ncbi:ABC transporter ATP-binding protein [Aureibacter tunicatorum]|nr:ABC transporter ATP-binding protein [Aureibacter tunicatorum]
MDCGPSSLRMIAKFYGKTYSLQFLRDLSYLSRDGVSMLGLSDAAEKIGFITKAYRLTWDQLEKEAILPCIIHWNDEHFVVLYKIKTKKNKKYIHVADPNQGLLKYSKKEFLNSWSKDGALGERFGNVLLLEPTPDFYDAGNEDNNKQNLSYLLKYIRPYKKYIFQLVLGMLTGTLIGLIFPFLTQSIVDKGISNNNLSFISMVLVAQFILIVGQTANEIIRNWLMLHVTSRVSISLLSNFLIKLMKLPIAYFDIKLLGDIIQRMEDHQRIQYFLTNGLINIIFAGITVIIYALIMAKYQLDILLIFLIGSAIYIVWVLLFLKSRRDLDYKQFQQSSKNQSNIIQLVTGMQEIKMNGCEKQKRWEWEKTQARLYKISLKSMSLDQFQYVGATFINHSKDILISFLVARSVVQGQMTLGMMMAVQYLIGQLNAPIQQFISFAQSAQDAKISLERLGEIHDQDDEEGIEQNKLYSIPKSENILLRNLTFQYEGPHSKKILEDVNFEILPGKITAIVGTSGSGKSTLMKLILGNYNPTVGEVLLNGIRINNYSSREWRKSCGVVMQEGFIFSDSIINNICVSDDYPNLEKFNKALEVSNLKEYIESLPLGYETKIGSDGHGLSTGQKQRILIARSVYKNPDYLFFDEATNALDANNERVIMENLEQFFKGRTVLIVAHRLSTVKNANQIIVLNNGKLVEKGNHEELISNKSEYYNLVKDQLEMESNLIY